MKKITSFASSKIIVSVVAILAACGVFGAGFYAGYERQPSISQVGLANKEAGMPSGVDFSPFWKAWNILNEKYVATKKKNGAPVTDQDKVWGAIQGLTQSLGDPYTVFFPPVENQIFQAQVAGNFEGVGMEVGIRQNILTVISPLKDSPAQKAGILAGDQILKINATSTADLAVDKAVTMIRGAHGTVVKLTLLRDPKKGPFEVSITRDVINIPTIDSNLRADGVFVIRLFTFTSTSPELFRGELQKFVDSGSNKLIVDLRGNPGGYLDAAVDMASWFLPEGKVIVRESFGANKDEQVYKSYGYDVFHKYNKPITMAILVDGGSASASEIFSGALSEQGVAKLVGTQTFGKGSVQELVPITSAASLKVTIARWLTPNGKSISEEGLTPDIVVKPDPAGVDKNPKNVKDTQLDAAVKLLLKK